MVNKARQISLNQACILMSNAALVTLGAGQAASGSKVIAPISSSGKIDYGSPVNRDLKPSNVFLTPHGVKLLDFGIARSASAAPLGDAERTRTAATFTGPGSIVGTPHYMAPEQASGLVAGPAADIFAAGCIL